VVFLLPLVIEVHEIRARPRRSFPLELRREFLRRPGVHAALGLARLSLPQAFQDSG
jgi:hypothetical protein